MYWQEDTEEPQPYQVPEDVVDLLFKVDCRSLPLDHAYALSSALCEALPWLADEPAAGIHLIHGAESGNGWIRPEDPASDVLYPSRRTRLTLRLPSERVAAATKLQGATLDIAGHALSLGKTSQRPLSTQTTLFARYVLTANVDDEDTFLQQVAELLEAEGIRAKKMLGGRRHTLQTPAETLAIRSLMIDGLEIEKSVRLQERGLGAGRKLGCGLFLPHKGLEAVNKGQQ